MRRRGWLEHSGTLAHSGRDARADCFRPGLRYLLTSPDILQTSSAPWDSPALPRPDAASEPLRNPLAVLLVALTSIGLRFPPESHTGKDASYGPSRGQGWGPSTRRPSSRSWRERRPTSALRAWRSRRLFGRGRSTELVYEPRHARPKPVGAARTVVGNQSSVRFGNVSDRRRRPQRRISAVRTFRRRRMMARASRVPGGESSSSRRSRQARDSTADPRAMV